MVLPNIIGQVRRFNFDHEDWAVYTERLDQYFVANSINNDKLKTATLISLIGAPTYKLLRDLCHPELPKEKKYDELSELLNKHLSPRMPEWRERLKFYEVHQSTGESISEWYARIKSLAVNCKWSDLEQVLKNKFVPGITSSKILDRLCEEDVELFLKK